MANQGYSKYQAAISLIGDLVLLFLIFNAAFFLRQGSFMSYGQRDYVLVLMAYLFSWWIIQGQQRPFVTKRGITTDRILLAFLRKTGLHIIVVYATMIVLRYYGISRLMLLYAFVGEVLILALWRVTYFHLIRRYRTAGFNYRSIVLVGNDRTTSDLVHYIRRQKDLGYRLLGAIGNHQKAFIDYVETHPTEDYAAVLEELQPDEVFCLLSEDMQEGIKDVVAYCEKNVIRVKLFPDFKQAVKKTVQFDFFYERPVLVFRQEPLESQSAQFLKRCCDIVFSSLVILLLLSWLIPLMALLIKLESRGPVFFGQLRTGKDNRNFKMLKFRSMAVNKDADKVQATKNDMRVTRLGRFIRKTSIDELPQFINVFKGDMSVVGPRPHMLAHTEQYSELINEYMVRHFVKPGITGWAQVNGYRGATTETEHMRMRVEYDVWYIENWSFLLDLIIIFRTTTNVFRGEKNAY